MQAIPQVRRQVLSSAGPFEIVREDLGAVCRGALAFTRVHHSLRHLILLPRQHFPVCHLSLDLVATSHRPVRNVTRRPVLQINFQLLEDTPLLVQEVSCLLVAIIANDKVAIDKLPLHSILGCSLITTSFLSLLLL